MIDWARVSELRLEIGADDFGDVVDLFLDEVTEVVERLASHQGTTKLEADLHFLKGSALNLGFSEFAKLCQNGESLSASGQGENVDVNAILLAFSQSRDAFLAGLETRFAA